jgi:phage terminase Nu1 subunit (DNA packaging protein)
VIVPRRTCACGCGADISHKKAGAKYLDDSHRQKGFVQRGEIRRPLASQEGAPPPDGDLPPDIAVTKAKQAVVELAIKEVQLERENHELAQYLGSLVPLAEVEGEMANRAVTIRSRILAVPSRFKSRRPHLTVEDVAALGELLDEVLTELANEEAELEDDEDGQGA